MERIIMSTFAMVCLAAPLAAGGERVEFSAPFAPGLSWTKPAERPHRDDLCLNGSWRFQAVAPPAGYKEGRDPAPALPAPDEQAWEQTPLRVPSPWNVNSFADRRGLGGDFRSYPGYPRAWDTAKMAWLEKRVSIPAEWRGKSVRLRFEALAGSAAVWVNGTRIDERFGLFLPIEMDIGQAVRFGEENIIRVGIRAPSLFEDRSGKGRRAHQGGSFWGQHIAGPWQDVFLTAAPRTRVADVFVKPLLDRDRLETVVTLANDTDADVAATVDASAFRWLPSEAGDAEALARPSARLDAKAALALSAGTVVVPARGTATLTLSAPVDGKLALWSPDAPNLYGLVTRVRSGDAEVDKQYTRFGWRQTALRGREFLLNGNPVALKGDSWHFMGIPQMTRRYAIAWYRAARDANLNAVRLHAQPFPAFYLDVADEMGMLVLDETAIWASDGGPKLDSEAYWNDSREHVAELVRRDRNHPSVFGWSVSNEVKPIVRGVMRNPPGMMDTLIEHYGRWAEICRELDPTRAWISADGEEDGEGHLPVYIVHYGGDAAMLRGEASGKPWGVGEAGNAYYGTPEQVAKQAGGYERAYESFRGRMEGVAISSYDSLVKQRKHQAAYRSIFNLAWYALEPLPFGKRDLSTPPAPEEGVFFTHFKEGEPGVQPERIGPYSSTLNPGYDPALPVYIPWPLFDAVRAASAEPPQPCPWKADAPAAGTDSEPPAQPAKSVRVLGGADSRLAAELQFTGVPLAQLREGEPDVLFVDGVNPPGADTRAAMDAVLARGGVVVVWGADAKRRDALDALLPARLETTPRTATSLVVAAADPAIAGLDAAALYFSELQPAEALSYGLGGPLVENNTVVLKACDTDWTLWNKQPEYAKTAMALRSEREAKPSGAALVRVRTERGRLYVTNLPVAARQTKAEAMVRTFLKNLGLPLEAGRDVGKPLLRTGDIARAVAVGSFPIETVRGSAELQFIDPAKGAKDVAPGARVENKPCFSVEFDNGVADFAKMKLDGPKQNAVAYLGFWVFSPRPLDDLLIEPNMPVVGLEAAADDAFQVWLNGEKVLENIRQGPISGGKAAVEALRLKQGWNHFFVKVLQAGGGWQFSGRLTCNQPEFLTALDSALAKP